jgi:hydroxypyruvate isomerase
LRFSLNISILFTEAPFLERFALARQEGFDTVEFWWPAEVSPDEVVAAVRESDLDVALINFDGGDLGVGERGLASDRATEARFRQNVPVALDLARALGCRRLNALAGVRKPRLDESEQRQILMQNIRWAADRAAEHGIDVLIEPINSVDVPGYLLTTTSAVCSFIAEVDRFNVRLQYDCYHAQRSEGNLAATLRARRDLLGHVQIADAPDRHRPGTGEIDVWYLLTLLAELGYDGFVGLEYLPIADTRSSLGWLPMAMRQGDVTRFERA